jgi:hypothetical protein
MDLVTLDPATMWREFNAVLAVITLALVARWWQWRRYFNSQERAFVHGAISAALATLVGSIHSIINGAEFSFGVPLATVALPFFIYGTLKPPDRIQNPHNAPRSEQ